MSITPTGPQRDPDYHRWYPGRQVRELGGMRFRVEKGRKTRGDGARYGDLVLYWETPRQGWQKVPFDFLFLAADVLCENEDILYPPRLGYKGGEKIFEYMRLAKNHGYEMACRKLYDDRGARDERGAA